ncbi:MAG: hypothetical protein IH840_08490 [Candidatus Heimdallarchaeota archaeon]|nr:hypothetical protein [Candidatus Heimdallarchaeota archaeon]
MTTQQKKRLYMTFSRAKDEYFLTNSMFKEIGDPDKYAVNQHYRTGPPMKLYLIERLENWISKNQERVEKAMLRRAKLSAAQLKSHEWRRQLLLNEIEKWVPELYIDKVTKKLKDEAYEYYLNLYEGFNRQLTTNGLIHYIRHNYSNYEEFLWWIGDHKGKTGVGYIYPIIREKLDVLIETQLKLKMVY